MNCLSVLERSRAQLSLLKVLPGALVEVVLAPVGPMWFTTHWLGRRQVLCAGGEGTCVACGSYPARVVGFVVACAVVSGKRRLFSLEVSPGAWSRYEMGCNWESVAKGQWVRANLTRPRLRAPLRIEVICGASSPVEGEQPSERSLVNAVAVLYGLRLMTPTESVQDWEAGVQPMLEDLVSRSVAQVEA